MSSIGNREIEKYELTADMPIGVMDSGLGGISVLREISSLLPCEKCVFYGDSANAPYGDKSLTEIQMLTEDVVKRLLKQKVKAVVIACNTASSAAGAMLRGKYPWLPIVAIEPALKPAVLHKPGSRVLVLATSTTIREAKFHRLMEHYENQAEIIPMPLPGLPEFVERGELDSPQLMEFLRSHFELLGERKVDSVVLGCTHYPFVSKAISDALGGKVRIFDGAAGTARQLKRLLQHRNLLQSADSGNIAWQNSSCDDNLSSLAVKLFHLPRA